LDSESRESLAGLLRDIGDKFASTEMQIIVCDHSPELAQAFQKTIRL
jgi:DNA repair exonuclease SbcCD ATPase subunit